VSFGDRQKRRVPPVCTTFSGLGQARAPVVDRSHRRRESLPLAPTGSDPRTGRIDPSHPSPGRTARQDMPWQDRNDAPQLRWCHLFVRARSSG